MLKHFTYAYIHIVSEQMTVLTIVQFMIHVATLYMPATRVQPPARQKVILHAYLNCSTLVFDFSINTYNVGIHPK